jgi:hypothetical protein
MKRIYEVTYSMPSAYVREFFDNWDAVIQTIQQSFNWRAPVNIPKEDQLTDKSRIGFATPNGNWIQISVLTIQPAPLNLSCS